MTPDIKNCHTPWPRNKSYCVFTRAPMLFIHIRQIDSTRFRTVKLIKKSQILLPSFVWTGP